MNDPTEPMDDSDHLKPCPFCGGDAEVLTMPAEDGDAGAGAMFVQCVNSRCMASSALVYPLGDDPKPLLLERWSRRAQPERVALSDAKIRKFAHKHLVGTGDNCIIDFVRDILSAQADGSARSKSALLQSIAEAGRCLGVAQAKDDKDAISCWSLKVNELATQPLIAEAARDDVVKMDGEKSRAYLIKFMRENFTDKTFSRYINENLAGDFAYQVANAIAAVKRDGAAEHAINQLHAAMRSVNAVAIECGNKYGACDQIDNDGVPYQSQWLADLLANTEATSIAVKRDDVAGDAKDAERYLWLRDKSEPGICAFYLSVGKAFDGVRFTQATVDEAIDAQIDAAIVASTKAAQ